MPRKIELITERLVIRTVTMDDAEDVAETWDLYGSPVSRSSAQVQIRRMMSNSRAFTAEDSTHLCLAVVHREDKRFIGWCGFDGTDEERDAPVLFYLIHRDYWGKGLGTEVASALLRLGFCGIELKRISAEVQTENLASKRILEKMGMNLLEENSRRCSFSLSRAEYMEDPSE